ncbi:MAG: hypothetical protein HOM18_04985 [Candidatus Marinimicrobia bacterium]|jgi:hypothetical protein|nr:hypothetical protein [Candidatus Neomarinimicrobiota bacterium]
MSAIWKVDNIESIPLFEGKENVAKNVYITVTDATTYSQKVGIDFSGVGTATNYIAWDSMKEDTVIAWVKSSLGDEMVAKIEADVSIVEVIAEEPALPW